MSGTSGVTGASGKASLYGTGDHEIDRKEEVSRINSSGLELPWATADQRVKGLPQAPLLLSSAAFEKPQPRAGVGAGSTSSAEKTRDPSSRSSAPFSGIRSYTLARALPERDRTDTSKSLDAGPYRLHAGVRRGLGGTEVVAFYTAYNRETKRAEYLVGPNELGTFRAQTKLYADAAARTLSQGTPAHAYEVESLRVTEALMNDGPGAALDQLGAAWREALSDRSWWAKTLTETVIAFAGAVPAATEAREATLLESGTPARYTPKVEGTSKFPAGYGETNKYGDVTYSTRGTAKDIDLARTHESVHSRLSPKTMNALREFRADVGMTAYEKSSVCRYIEEALAEGYAQVKVNGIRSLPQGLTFPITNGYVKLIPLFGEAAIGTVAYGGVLYGAYVVADGAGR